MKEWREPEDFGSPTSITTTSSPKTLHCLTAARSLSVSCASIRWSRNRLCCLTGTGRKVSWAVDFPLISRAQGVEHVASVGCLVTDGHQISA